MACQTNAQSIGEHLRHRQRALGALKQRKMIALAGSLEWAETCINTYQRLIGNPPSILVSDQNIALAEEASVEAIASAHVQHKLGQETDLLIWNGHSGLNPNALAAASGLIKGGGLLLLMIPSLTKLTLQPDPDYRRMCSFDHDLTRCGTRFVTRIADFIQRHEGAELIEENKPAPDYLEHEEQTLCPTEAPIFNDQARGYAAIEKVANGRRNRPLVITANRGRGKSSLLGIAAARLNKRIVITGPSKASTAIAFEHFEQTLEKAPNSSLTFVPPDELASTQHSADMVFVDEAAAIPVPILNTILHSYSRIVFSSTVHGYEGTGQGFSVRFAKALSDNTPGWKALHLTQPIRWAQNDPLETLIFKLLCLDADLGMVAPAPVKRDLPTTLIARVKQSELASDEPLIRQVIGLLVIAHYQTSPSDLRMLLDHPDLSLFVARHQDKVIGVLLCMNETLTHTPELHSEICAGVRRVKGQLLPQSLACFLGDTAVLQSKYKRIVRVAVHPDYFGQGLGTQLIRYINNDTCSSGKAHPCILGVSYGFTPELQSFWLMNGFETVRIGYQPDKASGTSSVIALKSDCIGALPNLKNAFRDHFRFGLSRYYRDLHWTLVESIICEHIFTAIELAPNDTDNAAHFAAARRAEYDCLRSVESVMLKNGHRLRALDKPARAILIMRILQQQSWEACIIETGYRGKKEALKQLQTAVSSFIR